MNIKGQLYVVSNIANKFYFDNTPGDIEISVSFTNEWFLDSTSFMSSMRNQKIQFISDFIETVSINVAKL